MKRYLITTITLFALCLFFACNGTRAGGAKASAWKPFLSAEAFQELTERSIKAIEMTAQSSAKDAAEKIEVEAAILAGYTLSIKKPNGDKAAMLRGAAVQAVQLARNGEVKKLAGFQKMVASAPKADDEVKAWKAYLQERQWTMEVFRGKAKGGEGLHADLHYHPKLKNLNGIEAFIGAIAGKKLSEENLDKIAKELPNLASRIAVIGSLTHEMPQEKNVADWHALSDQMRDSAIALADAGRKKDAAGVFNAAQTLENSCTQCHMKFKKN